MSVLIAHTHNVLNGVSPELFSDLKLLTECGSTLCVHKVVIAGVSSKYKKQLMEKPTDVLKVRNVKFSALQNIISFIYNGNITIKTGGDVQDFVAGFKIMNLDLGKRVKDMIGRLDTEKGESNSESSQENEEFKCTTCDKVFTCQKKFNRHNRDTDMQKQEKEKTTYTCEKYRAVYTVSLQS